MNLQIKSVTPWLHRLGATVLAAVHQGAEALGFVGEISMGFVACQPQRRRGRADPGGLERAAPVMPRQVQHVRCSR
jgi:hypothetical protein